MRIGTATFDASQVNAMARLNTQIAADLGAISTGQQRAAASDDPASAARSARLARTQADNARYASGLDLAEQRLGIMDKSLDGMANQLIRVKELAIQVSSETSSASDHKVVLTELTQIQKSLVSLGNAQDGGGAYLFAGARASAPAFAQDATTGAVVYNGLGEAAPVAVGDTATIRTSDSGPRLFGAITQAGGRSVFAVVADFIAALQQPEPARGDDVAIAARRQSLATALDGATAATDRIANVRADLGGRLNGVDSERARLSAVGDGLAQARSSLDDTDYAATITSLQRASTILQATQKSFAQVSSLSLFNDLH